MPMRNAEDIGTRFSELGRRGALIRSGGRSTFFAEDTATAEAWLCDVVNLIRFVATAESVFVQQADQALAHDELKSGVPMSVVHRMRGVLVSAEENWKANLLRRIEYMIAGATFDQFLDHAASYHKGNRKIESAVLGSAVLEDTIKKIAARHGAPAAGSLESLIDGLAKKGVFTPVKAQRVKGFAAVRNRADHAEWDEFDIKDVGTMIEGTRELIENFL